MPFTTDIKLRPPLTSGRRWLVEEPMNYCSPATGKNYVVDAGFATDLASVPRLPLTYALFGGEAAAAAVVHDWLYRHGKRYRQIKERWEADQVFFEAMRETGVSVWKATAMFYAVRLFGGRFFCDGKP